MPAPLTVTVSAVPLWHHCYRNKISPIVAKAVVGRSYHRFRNNLSTGARGYRSAPATPRAGRGVLASATRSTDATAGPAGAGRQTLRRSSRASRLRRGGGGAGDSCGGSSSGGGVGEVGSGGDGAGGSCGGSSTGGGVGSSGGGGAGGSGAGAGAVMAAVWSLMAQTVQLQRILARRQRSSPPAGSSPRHVARAGQPSCRPAPARCPR